MTPRYNELLWIFTLLPDDYIVLDTETTGLPDEKVYQISSLWVSQWSGTGRLRNQ